jgi:hypothetical protein
MTTVSVTCDNVVQHLSRRMQRVIALLVTNKDAIDHLDVGAIELSFGCGREVKAVFNRVPMDDTKRHLGNMR